VFLDRRGEIVESFGKARYRHCERDAGRNRGSSGVAGQHHGLPGAIPSYSNQLGGARLAIRDVRLNLFLCRSVADFVESVENRAARVLQSDLSKNAHRGPPIQAELRVARKSELFTGFFGGAEGVTNRRSFRPDSASLKHDAFAGDSAP